jgi:hypothetical protein
MMGIVCVRGLASRRSGAPPVERAMRFHHVQLFVSTMKPTREYKALEARLNELAGMGHFDPFSGGMRFLEENALHVRVQEGARVWETISGEPAPAFVSAGQDLVEQLIVGLGWRITAEVPGPLATRASLCATRSLLCLSLNRPPWMLQSLRADAANEFTGGRWGCVRTTWARAHSSISNSCYLYVFFTIKILFIEYSV